MANKECMTHKADFSVALSGECLADCPTVPAAVPATTTKVPGYHEVASVCTLDVAPIPGTTDNNPCTPIKPDNSVNMVKQECDADCADPLMGSHKFDSYCVLDTAKPNKDCKKTEAGKSVNLLFECVADCATVPATTPATTVNVPGMHEVDSKCSNDIAQVPASPNNNPCTPLAAGSSVNWVTE